RISAHSLRSLFGFLDRCYYLNHTGIMEEKELSRRNSSLRTVFNRINSFYTSIWRTDNSAFHKNHILGLKATSSKLQAQSGFTLIEIITALGVLTILATIILAAVNPIEQFRKAQDARRK